MFNSFIFYPILGIPLIAIGGILSLLVMFAAAITGFMISKGKPVSMQTHVWLARISLLLAIIHGSLGILAVI